MYQLGTHLLELTLLVSLFALGSSLWGYHRRKLEFVQSSRRAVLLAFVLVSAASGILLWALITHDFRVEYVASYTNSTLSTFYSITAFWAGQKGSMLFWAWILGGFSALTVYQNRKQNTKLMPYVMATLMVVQGFFLAMMLFAANPFETLAFTPQDGQGLNPLLQNSGMAMHPPTLYLGYIAFTIPFAFAIASLFTRKLDSQWITTTRKWTIAAWFFLTLGNLFGMKWAYVELGWGGFWAWDPVENASFLPWLTGTAFLHSVMIQERRGMLKVWNMSLIVITFLLTILGTFITRSGLISSVHSFGVSKVGPFFLWFLLIAAGVSVYLIITRLPDLESEHELDSLLSRESSFLLNNMLLLGAAFAVLWGTLFPIISEAVTGEKITVGAPFFNQVTTPIFLTLLLLTGICPLIAWRKATGRNFRRNFFWPLMVSVVAGVVFWVAGIANIYIWMSFTFSVFVMYTIGMEFWKGLRAKMRSAGRSIWQATVSMIRTNQRRYGGYIIHVGIVMIIVGITGSVGFKTEQKAMLNKGDRTSIKNYEIELVDLYSEQDPEKASYGANLNVYKNGAMFATMTPEKRIHRTKQDQPHTEVALHQTLKEDLYIIYAGTNEAGKAVLDIHINPLTVWIWAGGIIMAFGTLIALLPNRKKSKEIENNETSVYARTGDRTPVPAA
ncbi:MAG: heme lyase CcmF/NrfE family subunit [Candidatus Marinimicrobia bacterium]|nr:heme lyase CcmF/NrfE family subunit [Candidatus Neomarinimicrobiota bacterium]MCF7830335.1 heme lyase CcmF/NrfE family subunit [Candidatus Neomarinimicrobiota bacterium]MCF7882404.1 heme lyase CcmF/NrfE family subunit [Candidatus Neomarinimicrobiota bacterium]